MLLQSHRLLTGQVLVKKVACKHSRLWRLVMSNRGGACSEADWHAWYCFMHVALFNPKMYVFTQKPFFNGNLTSETTGDSRDAFLHWGDIFGTHDKCVSCCKVGVSVP